MRTRPLLAVPLALALGIGATSCATTSNDAARVGDATLTESELQDIVDGFVELDTALSGAQAEQSNITAGDVRDAITRWVTAEALKADLADRGVPLTDADRQDATDRLAAQQNWDIVPEPVKAIAVEYSAAAAAFATAVVTDETMVDAYNAGTATSGVVCAQALVVNDQVAADGAKARLDGGEAFVDVSADVTIDTGAGPDSAILDSQTASPCIEISAFSDRFAASFPALVQATAGLAIGEVSDPIDLNGAFALIRLRPADEVMEALRQVLAPQLAVGLQREVLAGVDPYIASKYGRWDPVTARAVALD